MQTYYPDQPVSRHTDEQGILASLARMVDAWDAADATRFAAEFTPDASYVIFAGLVYEGRDAIEREHVPVFEKWQKGSRMSQTVRSIRFLSDDTAVVLSEGGVGRHRVRHDKVQSYVFQRTAESDWACAAFQNTRRNRLFESMHRRASRRR